jgi:hypothetical protein
MEDEKQKRHQMAAYLLGRAHGRRKLAQARRELIDEIEVAELRAATDDDEEVAEPLVIQDDKIESWRIECCANRRTSNLSAFARRFLQKVASELSRRELGPGEVYRAICKVQNQFFDPPLG